MAEPATEKLWVTVYAEDDEASISGTKKWAFLASVLFVLAIIRWLLASDNFCGYDTGPAALVPKSL